MADREQFPGIPKNVLPVGAVPQVYAGARTLGRSVGSAGVQMPDIPCRLVAIKAHWSNAVPITVGFSASVLTVGSMATGTVNTYMGYELGAGDPSMLIPLANVNQLFARAIQEGQVLSIIVLA